MSLIWDIIQEVSDSLSIDKYKKEFSELTLKEQTDLITIAENKVLGI